MKAPKMFFVLVSFFILVLGSANAQSSTMFSISGSFVTTPVRGNQVSAFSAFAGITHNFQIGESWFGAEGGLSASLDSLQPVAVVKWYANKPGDGFHAGIGGSYFYSKAYTFAEAFVRLGYEIPFNPSLSLYVIASPGFKFFEDGGISPGGFQVPLQIGLSFKL